MSVRSLAEDAPLLERKGDAYVNVRIRDLSGVIQKVLDLMPGRSFDIFVEVNYLDRKLTFQG